MYCPCRVARVMLQRKYQEKVNHCVAHYLEQDEGARLTDIWSLIVQTLGLNIDKTDSSLSGIQLYVYVHTTIK